MMKKELYRQQKIKEKGGKLQQIKEKGGKQQQIKEKGGKQQQKDSQEVHTATEFTRIVTPPTVPQRVKDLNMSDTPTPQHKLTKEVSFNETTEIFPDNTVSPVKQIDESSGEERTPHPTERSDCVMSPVKQINESSGEETTPHHTEKSESVMSSQDSDENIISPSPPEQTICSFRRDEEGEDIISPSPPRLTMRSVRRDSNPLGKTPTSRERLAPLSSAPLSKRQSCDAVRRTLIGSAHSTPVSVRSQTSLLEGVDVTPISGETTREGADGSSVFLTPRRGTLPEKQSLGRGDSRRSLMSSGEMRVRKDSTIVINHKNARMSS
jgi:hypothetical protein